MKRTPCKYFLESLAAAANSLTWDMKGLGICVEGVNRTLRDCALGLRVNGFGMGRRGEWGVLGNDVVELAGDGRLQ